jgi:hypothetical protein
VSADPIKRVEQLVRLALDPGAALEEARTSAMIACRLIHEHWAMFDWTTAFQEGLEAGQVMAQERAPKSSPPPPSSVTQSAPRRVIRARWPGGCRACGVRWDKGARIAWNKSAGAVCIGCHQARKAA